MDEISHNYVPAFWFAMGVTRARGGDLRIATEFANFYALEQLDNPQALTGIMQSFDLWVKLYNVKL